MIITRAQSTWRQRIAEARAEDSMRDWPLTLKINAAAAQLAPCLYYLREKVYGVGQLSWDSQELPVETKQLYVEAAERALRGLAPMTEPLPVALSLVRK